MAASQGAGGMMPNVTKDAASALAKSIPQAELQPLSKAGAEMPQHSTGVSGSGASFENMLGDMVHDVVQKQAASSTAVNGLLRGQKVSLHQAMISMEEANVSFQMMVEVRNRLLDGYQELMRMQI